MEKTTSEKGLAFFKSLSLADLRKRQTINEWQLGQAYKQKNTKALEFLQAVNKQLTEAVMVKLV